MSGPMVVDEVKQIVDHMGAGDFAEELTQDMMPEHLGGPKDEPKVEPKVEPKAEPKVEPKAEPKVEPKVEPKAEPKALSPEDLRSPSNAADVALPEGAVPDNLIDALFKGDDKAKQAFMKERGWNKELRQKVAALEGDATSVPELRTQLEQAQARASELEEQLGQIDVTRKPEFKKQYDDRIETVGQKMVRALVSEGVEEAEAVEFVRAVVAEKKPSAREGLIGEFAPGLVGTMVAYANEIDEVDSARVQAVQKWRETNAALEDQRIREQSKAMSEQADALSAKAIEDALKLGNAYFQKVEGDDDWNAEVDTRTKAVKGVLLSGDLNQVAPYVAEGITAADLRTRYTRLLAEKRDLQAQLDQALKGAPRYGGRGGPLPPGPSMEDAEREAILKSTKSIDEMIMDDLLPPGT